MKTIKGKDLIIKIDNKTIYHAISHEIQISSEFEEWETKDSNGKQNEFSGISGTASANGIMCISETSDTETFDSAALLDAQLAGQKVTLTAMIGDEPYTGDAWIDSLSFAGEVSKKATWNASFKFYNLEK